MGQAEITYSELPGWLEGKTIASVDITANAIILTLTDGMTIGIYQDDGEESGWTVFID